MPIEFNEDRKELELLHQLKETKDEKEKLKLFNEYMNNEYEATWNSIKEDKWDLFNEFIESFIFDISNDLKDNEYLYECEEIDGTSSYESKLKTDYYILADSIRDKKADEYRKEIEKEKGKFVKIGSFIISGVVETNIYENETAKDIEKMIFDHCSEIKHMSRLTVAYLPDGYLSSR